MEAHQDERQTAAPLPQIPQHGHADNAIAVVGMACRFPGEASDIDGLWRMLEMGGDAWTEIPKSRMNIDGYYHPDPSRQGSFSFRGAHFLKDDIATFDASFFSIAPNEVIAMDPQQRMLLEVTFEALESAGIPKESLEDSDTTVFIGSFVKDYEQVCLRDQDHAPQYAATGNGIAILANRISHCYNLAGTSQTIDTGCSASLVGVHQACQSLLSRECSTAIAGGVGLILTPNTSMPMTSLGFLSSDGRSYAFDSRANGYGRGEGAGIVILRRLEDAIAAHDTIRAVIRATASNQDGRTPGITLPSMKRQVANIVQTYRKAGLDPTATAFVECHGTGTKAGDIRELEAVHRAITYDRDIDEPIFVGSIKTNVGHLEGAAGIAGLIKAVLAVEKGYIPKHLNYESPNPDIHFKEWRVKVPTELTPWPRPGLRRASVNCFGFGGTNAHAIVDDAEHYLAEAGLSGYHGSRDFAKDKLQQQHAADHDGPRLFVYSAHERERVELVARKHAPFIRELLEKGNMDVLARYAYTLLERRSRMEWKGFMVASSIESLEEKIERGDLRTLIRSSTHGHLRVALLFSGQGAQWHGMGRELLKYQVFRSRIRAADEYMRQRLGSGLSLLEELQRPPEDSQISKTRVAQPATTAVQMALVDLLRASNVKPVAVVGHSSGEIAAAYASGALSDEDAWAISYYRGSSVHLWQETKGVHRPGRMLVVGLPAQRIHQFVDLAPAGSVQVACYNDPEMITLSGDAHAIETIGQALAHANIFHRPVQVDVAYHSHYMKEVAGTYRNSISNVLPRPAPPYSAAMYSSVTGDRIEGLDLTAQYWADNLTSPVLFHQALQRMISDLSPDVVVEVSPQAVWRRPVGRILDSMRLRDRPRYLSMLGLSRDAVETTLNVLGELWALGGEIKLEWVELHAEEGNRQPGSGGSNTMSTTSPPPIQHLHNLPPYPWNHERRFWFESQMSLANRFRSHGREDIIGAPFDGSISLERRWRGFFRLAENPWMDDHRVQKSLLYPASGMVAMAIEAGKQLAEAEAEAAAASALDRTAIGYEISDFVILAPIILTASGEVEHSISTSWEASRHTPHTSYRFSIYTRASPGLPSTKHAGGRLTIIYAEGRGSESALHWPRERLLEGTRFRSKYDRMKAQCDQQISPRQLYERLDNIGLNYGPMFRNITALSRQSGGSNYCVSEVRVPDTKSCMPYNFEFPHIIHPATLDSILQTVFALGSNEPMLPCSVESVFVGAYTPQGADASYRGFACARGGNGAREMSADIVMFGNAPEQPVVVLKGLEFRSAAAGPGHESGGAGGGLGFLPNHRNLCSEIVWREDVAVAPTRSLDEWMVLLGHRNPALSALHVGASAELVSKNLRLLSPDGLDTPLFAVYAVTGTNEDEFAQITAKLLDGGMGSILERVEWQRDVVTAAPAEFDLVVVESGSALDEAYKAVRVGGHLLVDLGHPAQHPPAYFQEAASALRSMGVVDGRLLTHDLKDDFTPSPRRLGRSYMACRKPEPAAEPRPLGFVIVTPDVPSASTVALRDHVHIALQELHNVQCTITTLTQTASTAVNDKAVYLSLVEAETPKLFNINKDEFAVVRALFRARNLIWVTGGCQMEVCDPRFAVAVGLARTLRSEEGHHKLVSVDIDILAASAPDIERTGREIAAIFKAVFAANSSGCSPSEGETEYVLRRGRRFIPRLKPLRDLNGLIEKGRGRPQALSKAPLCSGNGRSLKLDPASVLGGPDGPYFVEDADAGRALGPLEVRIRPVSCHLLPHDAPAVSGQFVGGASSNETEEQMPEAEIGTDLFGTVIEVGARVCDFAVDDMVVAFARGAVKATVVVGVHRVWKKKAPDSRLGPGFLGPTPWMTAYYALLIDSDRIEVLEGKWVLILAAASAYGQAAVQLGHMAGSRVLAGVASDAQRQVVCEELGIPAQFVVDTSDESSFVAAVRRHTNGRGADVIFNPTPNNVQVCLECVAGYGRVAQVAFPNLGTPTMRKIPRKIVHYEVIDVWNCLRQDKLAHLWDTTRKFSQYSDETAAAVVHDSFEHLPRAMETFAADPYLGLHVLHADPAMPVTVPVSLTRPTCLSPDASYVVVGGLGGVGQTIARLLVGAGALHLLFISRSGAGAPVRAMFLEQLERLGARCHSLEADICDSNALRAALDSVEGKIPPIRGVIQCAAVLDDSTFDKMTYEKWSNAVQPKSVGSWNLHQQLPRDMDFFVLLSSAVGVMGNRGQANYSAGNTFQDSLALYRSSSPPGLRGGHSISLDLGLVLEAGLVAENEALLDMMRANGFFGVALDHVLFLVQRALAAPGTEELRMPAQVVTAVGTGGLAAQNKPPDPYWQRARMFAHLNQIDLPAATVHPANIVHLPTSPTSSAKRAAAGGWGNGSKDLRAAVCNASSGEEAAAVATGAVARALAKFMGMGGGCGGVGGAAALDTSRSALDYGVDSLVKLNITRWIADASGVAVGDVNDFPSIAALGEKIAELVLNSVDTE